MPNWCTNKLTISERTDGLGEFLKQNGFSFKSIAPPQYPEDPDGIGWGVISAQNDAWGTKWDLNDDESKDAAKSLLDYGYALFDTAWSPPINVILALSKMFPEADFRLSYTEQGMGFYGIAQFSGGICYCDDCRDVDDKDDYISFLVEEMDYSQEDAEDAVASFSDEEE